MGPLSQQVMPCGDTAHNNFHRRYSQDDQFGVIYQPFSTDAGPVSRDDTIREEINSKRFAQTFEFERLDLWQAVDRVSTRSAQRARMRIQHLELEIAYLSARAQLPRSGPTPIGETAVVSAGRAMIRDWRRGGSIDFAWLRAMIEVDEPDPRYQLRGNSFREMLFIQVSPLALESMQRSWGNIFTLHYWLPLRGDPLIRPSGEGLFVPLEVRFENPKQKKQFFTSVHHQSSTRSIFMIPGTYV